MYEEFFGLRGRAFDLTTDPRFLFLSATHREALRGIRYAFAGRAGVSVLIGEVGTGKSTIVRAALSDRKTAARIVYLNNPLVSRQEFFELLNAGFELNTNASRSKTQLLLELSRSLLRAREAGHRVGLVIDEAQSLPDELMEEVRLLANMEVSNAQLLPVLLVGQPELADRLNQASLRQLKQRIALRCRLTPLEPQETAAYVETCLRTVGAKMASVLSPAAVRLIHECSRGLPRLISVICDNALLSGFVAGHRPVGDDIVLQVCRDLDLASGYTRAACSADGPGSSARSDPCVGRGIGAVSGTRRPAAPRNLPGDEPKSAQRQPLSPTRPVPDRQIVLVCTGADRLFKVDGLCMLLCRRCRVWRNNCTPWNGWRCGHRHHA